MALRDAGIPWLTGASSELFEPDGPRSEFKVEAATEKVTGGHHGLQVITIVRKSKTMLYYGL